MPYLHSKIEKHNDGCREPSAKRLYIRDNDDKGKQRFVSYGVICPSCGVLVTEDYHPNPTAIQKQKYQFDKEYTPEQLKRFRSIDLDHMIDTALSKGRDRTVAFNNWRQKLMDAGMTDRDARKYIIKIFDKKNILMKN